MATAQEVIRQLDLKPLPEEGGYYREIYRSSQIFTAKALPSHPGQRCFSTLIYYLITPEEFSGLHRVKGSLEVFHFYAGDAVKMVQISDSGERQEIILGRNFANQETPQAIVEPNVWQGTKLLPEGNWALLGCQVVPGFEFADFEALSRSDFLQRFPQHKETVLEYTRP